MKKELRKLYKIKEMRREGLSYEERGKRIVEMRDHPMPTKEVTDKDIDKSLKYWDGTPQARPPSCWRRFIIWLKKLNKK